MGELKTYEDLVVWQKAYELAKQIYITTKDFPSDEKYGLISQIRRAAVSVPSNIVEGFARKGIKDSSNFYVIASASLEELKFQIKFSKDLGYLTDEHYKTLKEAMEEAGRLLGGWMRSQSIRN